MTEDLGYKYDIFDENARVKSSVSPSVRYMNKMFGGRQVEVGEVPWHVDILYHLGFYSNQADDVRIGSEYYYQFGGGVIVSTTKVVSVANLFVSSDRKLKSASMFRIIAGHSNIKSSKQTVGIDKIALHP